ncbi:MAG TPA: MoxR family ATPase [Planctomycetota bacterium]|nr:MoxR family ATPase [Planctomycetota bacterium]
MSEELNPEAVAQRTDEFRQRFERVRSEIGRVIVGQKEIVEQVLVALFAGGHCLLEGVPGLGKTLLVRTLSQVLDLRFGRIQFTPDLMPADIIGTKIVMEDDRGRRAFEFQRGPIFAQMILADEINRATPKTQSALLEAMQEGSITVGGEMHRLEQPFLVMATQNPLEMDGTYPLPEAQLDRFFFKVLVRFPSREDLAYVLDRTVGSAEASPERIMDGEEILSWRRFVRDVVVAPHVKDYAIRVVLATHPASDYASAETRRVVRYGSSPRGLQSIVLAAKIYALLAGRYHVGFEDIRRAAHPVLRHRILLAFEGEAEGVSTDGIVDRILEEIPAEIRET